MLGVRASGAFPGAFPPVPLAYTRYVPGPGDSVIAKKEVATFIDGGILDNTPVGLAVALDAWRIESTAPHSALDGLLPPEPRTYLFLEPLVTSWMLGNEGQARSRKARRDMLETYVAFVRDLLGTTTDAQLANTAEQYPFVRRESADWTEPRLSVPERHMPITGARFDHFMAFLERDFRVFDFYVGMADAYVHLERERCMAAADDTPCGGDDDMRQLDAELKTVNPYYQCMRAYYDSDTARVLKRITSDELPAECEVLEQELCIAPGPHDSPEAVEAFLKSRAVLDPAVEDRCLEPAIANHNFRALLAAMHNYKVWLQSDRYTEGAELDRFFEELGGGEQTERFIYVDLPTHLQRSDGYMTALGAKQAFRSLMQQGIEQLAEQQGRIGRYALLLGGRPAADAAFGKAYPKQIVGVGIAQNGFEVVYGLRILRSPWRWDTTFRFFNLGRESLAPGLDPFMGDLYLATQVTRILSPLKFLDFELGGGWALSERLAFNGINPGHVAFRTGPRAYIALVILQRIYLALNVDYYPVVELDPAYRNLGTTVADNWEFNLAAGWRFLY
jgi:hypothetical protein